MFSSLAKNGDLPLPSDRKKDVSKEIDRPEDTQPENGGSLCVDVICHILTWISSPSVMTSFLLLSKDIYHTIRTERWESCKHVAFVVNTSTVQSQEPVMPFVLNLDVPYIEKKKQKEIKLNKKFFARFPNIRKLALRNISKKVVHGNELFKLFPDMRSLYMSEMYFDNTDLSHVNENLESLEVNCPESPMTFKIFAYLKNLKHLTINSWQNYLNGQPKYEPGFQDLKDLESLSLSYCHRVRDKDVQLIWFPKLRKFEIYNCHNFTMQNVEALAIGKREATLEMLMIKNCSGFMSEKTIRTTFKKCENIEIQVWRPRRLAGKPRPVRRPAVVPEKVPVKKK